MPVVVDFQWLVQTKLNTIIENQDETLSILRLLHDDVLPSPVDCREDLVELCARLQEEIFMKKMVRVQYCSICKNIL